MVTHWSDKITALLETFQASIRKILKVAIVISLAARKSFNKRINKRWNYVLPAAFVGDQEEEVKPHQIGEEEKKQKEGSEIFRSTI